MDSGGGQETRALEKNDPAELGPYALMGRLEWGGMGVIFVASGRSGDPVLVKTPLLHTLPDEGVRLRFSQEAEALRRLQVLRPMVTPLVLQAQPSAPIPYIVMEYLRGQTLRSEAPIAMPRLGGLAMALARALGACHRQGIVHNDLTPSNVVVTCDGVRLIDWGLATYPGARVHPSPGEGTRAYLAPERFAAAPVGSSADIFSWACTVAYAATGRPLFGQPGKLAVVEAIVSGDPDLSNLPAELVPTLERALDKSPDRRPDAAEVIALLGGPPSRRGRSTAGGAPDVTGVRAAWGDVQQMLVDTDSDPSVHLARTLAHAGGATGDEARDLTNRLLTVGGHDYLVAKTVMDELEAAVGGGRRSEIAQLLGPRSITRPSGVKTSIGNFLGELVQELVEIRSRAEVFATKHRQAEASRLAATAQVEALVQRAVTLRISEDRELVDAAHALEEWASALKEDPAFADSTAYQSRIDAATRHLDELEHRRRAFDEQRHRGSELLLKVEEIVDSGRRAFLEAKEKFTELELCPPLDHAVVETQRAALARIEAHANSKHWERAADDLDAWLREAEETLLKAKRILRVNRSPFEQRDQLRLKLESYQAMAAANGVVEEEPLPELHADAHRELWNWPCDLAWADRLVADYVRAVLAKIGRGPGEVRDAV